MLIPLSMCYSINELCADYRWARYRQRKQTKKINRALQYAKNLQAKHCNESILLFNAIPKECVSSVTYTVKIEERKLKISRQLIKQLLSFLSFWLLLLTLLRFSSDNLNFIICNISISLTVKYLFLQLFRFGTSSGIKWSQMISDLGTSHVLCKLFNPYNIEIH